MCPAPAARPLWPTTRSDCQRSAGRQIRSRPIPSPPALPRKPREIDAMHDGPAQQQGNPAEKSAAEIRDEKLRELESLRARERELEQELQAAPLPAGFQ